MFEGTFGAKNIYTTKFESFFGAKNIGFTKFEGTFRAKNIGLTLLLVSSKIGGGESVAS